MAKKKALPVQSDDDETGEPETLSAPDPFRALNVRLISLYSRLDVLKKVLACDRVPNELGPAAWVLGETAKDAVRLCDDLESWAMAYEHYPREARAQRDPEVRRLAQLPPDEYARVRYEKAEGLGLCVLTLDCEVTGKRFPVDDAVSAAHAASIAAAKAHGAPTLY